MSEATRGHLDDRSPETVRVVRALRSYANESELYVGAAGREAAMHRTDLSGLALVMDRGLQGEHPTPGQLSAALQLSAPATSAMLDRLERLGHVTRSPHPTDRRSVVVEITDHALEVGGAMFGRLAAHLAPVLAGHTDEELALVAQVLEEVGAATRAAREEVSGRG
ncbi:MarR family transcriptional regulator [Nocardioides sp. KIGAM211]|uniref:MarR family transcriptional regulator n=1 Tax=Nocardioides luti TaxID=2761101 RepID=A0A7X0VBG8_9ACTN|nr:MarR family transcriptional regulator [Nocardioides luti]MBB6628395.1 MarR family transcriptional regulator [Nocardioides luti]